MLRLSKKADYALIAMKHLALRPDEAASSAREIAEQYDIPVELMAKVLQRLAREGLLASHQGTRGGYQLSRAPSAISVADVIQAVDGPLTVTACSTDEENCDQYSKCSVRDPFGWKAAKAVEHAREQVAALIGARFREIIFTSGATESNNLAIKGVVASGRRRGVVTLATEHRAVLDPCVALERRACPVTVQGV